MKRTRQIIALVVALPMLAVSVEAGAVVLCFGSDGHVSVEDADLLSRCAESSRREHAEDAEEAGCDACGPCNDIELFMQTATLAGLSKKLTATAPSILSEPMPAKALTGAVALLAPLPTPAPAVVPLRTTVLLI